MVGVYQPEGVQAASLRVRAPTGRVLRQVGGREDERVLLATPVDDPQAHRRRELGLVGGLGQPVQIVSVR